jgi:biopolymer transport protein ExbD
MPWFGLVAFLCYLVCAIPVWMIVLGRPEWRPKGLWVRVLKPGVQAPRVPGIEPVLVRVAADHSLFVDSQPVSWEDFDAALLRELKSRPPHWPVYLEGDPNLEWNWPAKVIDRIRGLQAEVVLVTRPSP